MIYTVTFNPAIDYIVKVDNFKKGDINRSEDEKKYPGGKGINVSRVLKSLKVENVALGFIGGFTGEFIKSALQLEGMKTDFIQVNGDTRINIKLKSDEETDINGMGPKIEEADIRKLIKKIENVNYGDCVVLAGNVQNEIGKDIYARLQSACAGKGVNVAVDATGEFLINTLAGRPFLVKPNIKELGEIFNIEIKNTQEAFLYGEKLRDAGAKNVIVSMGGDGALLICEKGCFFGKPVKGIVKNSVGAGDSMVAGFIANFSKSGDPVEAFKWAVACGSATAFSMDICTEQEVLELIDKVQIEKIAN